MRIILRSNYVEVDDNLIITEYQPLNIIIQNKKFVTTKDDNDKDDTITQYTFFFLKSIIFYIHFIINKNGHNTGKLL